MRVVRLGAYGLFIDGPIGSAWYDVLEQHVFPKEPLSTKAVLSKTALDQVVYATIMTGVCCIWTESGASQRAAVQQVQVSRGCKQTGALAATWSGMVPQQ